MGNDKVQLFEDQRIRTAWDDELEEWYFSVVDVVGVLTESANYETGRKYWNKLKQRLKEEGNELVTNCHQLKMTAADGKKRLTDEWQKNGVQQGREYAILTDEISKAWSGMSTKQYKTFKGLKKENLRDNMSDMELILNMLAESTTTEISKQKNPATFSENLEVARSGGEAADEARRAVEKRTGKSVITSKNAVELNDVVTGVIKEIVGDDESVVADAAALPKVEM